MPGVCCFWGAGERRPALDAGQLRIGVAHIGKRHAFGRVLTIDTGEDGHEFCAGDGLALLEGAVAIAGNGVDVGQCADRDRVPLAGRNVTEIVVAAVILLVRLLGHELIEQLGRRADIEQAAVHQATKEGRDVRQADLSSRSELIDHGGCLILAERTGRDVADDAVDKVIVVRDANLAQDLAEQTVVQLAIGRVGCAALRFRVCCESRDRSETEYQHEGHIRLNVLRICFIGFCLL